MVLWARCVRQHGHLRRRMFETCSLRRRANSVYGYGSIPIDTYRYIFSGMNIHLPAILGFTRYQGFDPSPYKFQ